MYVPPPEIYNEKYSYSKITSNKITNLGIPSIHVHNLIFNNVESLKPIFFPGKTFITVPAAPYYHSMIDAIGVYELLKSEYPDLSIKFCSRDKHRDFKKHMKLKSDYVNFLLNLYSDPNSVWDIYDIQFENLHFEEVVFLPTQSVSYNNRLLAQEIQDSVGDFDWDTCFEIRKHAAKKLKEKIMPLLTKKEKKIKVYSAREQYNKTVIHNDPTRLFLEEYKIIEYFKNLNYEIVNLESMNLIDQFNLFYNASNIAGIKGSNLFGAIFADPETELIEIYNTNFWRYQMEDYFYFFKLNVIDIAKEDAAKLEHNPDIPPLSSSLILQRLDEYFKQ